MIQPAVLKCPRQQAQRDRQHDRQQQRRAHQPQRGRNAFADHLQHRAVVNQRIAEIAPQDVLQPQNVLRDQRLIQPQALANTFDIFRSHARCDVRRHRIAGRELDQQNATSEIKNSIGSSCSSRRVRSVFTTCPYQGPDPTAGAIAYF